MSDTQAFRRQLTSALAIRLETNLVFQGISSDQSVDDELMDQIASGTLERPDFKARGSASGTFQHRGILGQRGR
jgi:hypothetical protein